MFRGFVYRGFVRRPGNEPIAIVVISLAWMLLHVQYDWRDLPQIFIIGAALGWIRWSSGSTVLTIFLHALLNLWATIETVITLELLRS
jgi:membrane protease YdiL (CAAX protease family)